MDSGAHEHYEAEATVESLEEKITAFWRSVEPDVRTQLREYIGKRYRSWSDDERSEVFEEMLIKEELFVREILSQVAQLTEQFSDGRGRILFDVDNTLGVAQWSDDRNQATGFFFRPSALPLMDYLKKNYQNVSIGLL